MSEVEKIKSRVQALLKMTEANGCSEAEALNATRLAGRLMDQFQLSAKDLFKEDLTCIEKAFPVSIVNRPSYDGCMSALAAYCDLKIWFSKGQNTSSYKVFGYKHDIDLFEYLFDIIKRAFETESSTFKRSVAYLNSNSKKTSTTSFQRGMSSSLYNKLVSMKEERNKEEHEIKTPDGNFSTQNTTALVVMKQENVRNEFSKYCSENGMFFRSVRRVVRKFNSNAFNMGKEAGNKVSLSRGIGNVNINLIG